MPRKKKSSAEAHASAQKIWLAGLGALAAAEEEGGKLFHNLVDKGEHYQSSLREPVERATRSVTGRVTEIRRRAGRTLKAVEDAFDERVGSALQRIGVPTRREIAELSRKVEALTRKLETDGTSRRKPRKAASAKVSKKAVAKKKVARKTAKKKAAR